jgi:hypothetical protein
MRTELVGGIALEELPAGFAFSCEVPGCHHEATWCVAGGRASLVDEHRPELGTWSLFARPILIAYACEAHRELIGAGVVVDRAGQLVVRHRGGAS